MMGARGAGDVILAAGVGSTVVTSDHDMELEWEQGCKMQDPTKYIRVTQKGIYLVTRDMYRHSLIRGRIAKK
uniref:Uncharacterized protein n=1 Tax=Romanomermis culicivorax TaxID=13658 RepID=A0A915JP43_ROMCU